MLANREHGRQWPECRVGRTIGGRNVKRRGCAATGLALVFAHDDIRALVADRPVAQLVQRIAPGRTSPVFPAAWLGPLAR